MSASESEPTALRIAARDGYELGATLAGPADRDGRVVLINGATAVPHRFYRRFAARLVAAGYTALTYDYRGVGASRPRTLRGFEATMRDWAFSDMDGVVDWILADLRPRWLGLVGHSFGGQVAGMLENRSRVDAMVTSSSQSGYWRLQGGTQKWVVGLHVHVTLPVMSALLGYMPMGRLGAGEDLPRGVATEWARWCRRPGYLLDDPTLPLDRFDDFDAPVLAYSFEDDDWGTARAVDAMMSAYPRVERRHVVPADRGLSSVGHMGFFKENAAALWEEVVDWLDRI